MKSTAWFYSFLVAAACAAHGATPAWPAFRGSNCSGVSPEAGPHIRISPTNYYASPVAADGRIYLASLPGKLTVVQSRRRPARDSAPGRVWRAHSRLSGDRRGQVLPAHAIVAPCLRQPGGAGEDYAGQIYEAKPDAGPKDEEYGQPSVPPRTSLARSSCHRSGWRSP